VRIVCVGCSETYTPQPFEQAWLQHELGAEVSKYSYVHGPGCSLCNGTGYQGRVGVYELLEMNNELIDAASHHDPNHFIKVGKQHMAGKTLRKSAVDLVIKKQTTIAEAMRISNQFED
jgi:MSHA biogenesis protein MshE